MILKRLIKEPWPRIIGIPIVSFILTVLVHDSGPVTIQTYAVTLLFTSVLWNGDYYIILGFRKKWPELDDTHKRILSMTVVICAYNLTADYIICSLLGTLGVEGFGNYWDEGVTTNISKNLITTLIIGTLYETGYFFDKWKKQTIEIERVKSQQLRSELNVLKNQISPHFLFNSLNTLITLIHENPNKAARFTEELSRVYRYILQYKEKEIIHLRTELDFIASYNYLMKMRFEESIILKINISDEDLNKYVAPLTIQMLVENAIKHNVVSHSKVLTIDIYTENGKSLIVRNNLQRKTQGVKSLGTGLENIKQRYRFLSDKEVDIIETREHFMVALPLIRLSSEIEHIGA